MALDVQDGLLTHSSGNRVSVFSTTEDGGLNLRVRNGGEEPRVCIDAYTREERRKLIEFLRQGIDD